MVNKIHRPRVDVNVSAQVTSQIILFRFDQVVILSSLFSSSQERPTGSTFDVLDALGLRITTTKQITETLLTEHFFRKIVLLW